MARAKSSLLQRMRPDARLRAHATAVVLTGVLSLIAAPGWSALRNECDLCPPTCPMHHHANATEDDAPHLRCHGAPHGAHSAPANRLVPRVDRPPCGNHGVTS